MAGIQSRTHRQGRRGNNGKRNGSTTTLMSVMIILVALVSRTYAYEMKLEARATESGLFKELAARGEIHIDTREPPLRSSFAIRRRQVGDEASTTTETEATATSTTESAAASLTETSPSAETTETTDSTTATEASVVPTTVSGSTVPSVTVVTTSVPSAFDTSLGSNFTKPSCPTFFSTFLSNSTFQACLPVSLFLQNSNSFFKVEQSASLLTQTLDAACEVPLAVCMPLLSNLAGELIQDDNCGQDYSRQNPLVLQAYNGLMAYEPLYRATCLKSQETGNYCFSDAILNTTNPTDFYPYYTAVGMTLPSVVHPTCSQCLKDTMDIFASYATVDNQPLAKTYLACATQIDGQCGAGFAQTDIKTGAVSTPGQSAASMPQIPVIAVGLTVTVSLLLGL